MVTLSDPSRFIALAQIRISKNQLKGAILLAGVFEGFVGASGFLGFFLKFIGPVTISPGAGASYYYFKKYVLKHQPIILESHLSYWIILNGSSCKFSWSKLACCWSLHSCYYFMQSVPTARLKIYIANILTLDFRIHQMAENRF